MSVQQALQHDAMRVYRGICLTDLDPEASQTIRVTAPSLMPGNLQGPVKAGSVTNELEYMDRSGKKINQEATTSNYIEATWIGKDYHTYPPQVRFGEQVLLYQQGTSDKYFWDTVARNPNQRQLDRMRLAVSATPYTQQAKTDKNTYSLTIDPAKQQRITIQTAGANKEKHIYCIDIDAKNSHIAISDDKGDGSKDSPHNSIVLKSEENTIQLTNNDKTSLSLIGKDIIMYSPRDIRIRADRQLILDTPTMTLNGQVPGEESVIYIHGTAISFKADNFNISSKILGIESAVKHIGSIVTGPMRVASVVTGDPGAAYAAATTNTQEGSHHIPGVNADTDTSGGGDREVTAYPQFMAACNAAAEAITALGGNGSSVVSAGHPGNIPLIKGA